MTYNILSPDEITIQNENFTTMQGAIDGLNNWVKRYESQGYYSSNYGRINLDLLVTSCQFVTYKEGETYYDEIENVLKHLNTK